MGLGSACGRSCPQPKGQAAAMMHSMFGCGRRAATRPQDCPSDSTTIRIRLWWRRAEIIAITTAQRIGLYPLAILYDAVQMLLQATHLRHRPCLHHHGVHQSRHLRRPLLLLHLIHLLHPHLHLALHHPHHLLRRHPRRHRPPLPRRHLRPHLLRLARRPHLHPQMSRHSIALTTASRPWEQTIYRLSSMESATMADWGHFSIYARSDPIVPTVAPETTSHPLRHPSLPSAPPHRHQLHHRQISSLAPETSLTSLATDSVRTQLISRTPSPTAILKLLTGYSRSLPRCPI